MRLQMYMRLQTQRKETKEESSTHRQALITCAKAYANAEQEVLFIPDTSVVKDIQYAISLLKE
ncbi:2619_t:CDS:2 [Funneliformis geosporum]|nr:2619_t:CDS:2 [Funneliformis geosporum]